MTSIDTTTSAASTFADPAISAQATSTAGATQVASATSANASALGLKEGMTSAQCYLGGNNFASSNQMSGVFNLLTQLLGAMVSMLSQMMSLMGQRRIVPQSQTAAQNGTGSSSTNTTNNGTGSSATGSTGTTSGTSGATGGASTGAASGTTGTGSAPATQVGRPAFNVLRDEKGQITVRTLDGFMVKAEGKDQAWSIIGPDGKATRIWGDPHVKESDGDRWDFKDQSTFVFGNNKVTVEVVPAGNGTTFSARITLYSGNERVTIGGIRENRPVIEAVSSDGKQHDDSLSDGTIYNRIVNARGDGWVTTQNGQRKEMAR